MISYKVYGPFNTESLYKEFIELIECMGILGTTGDEYFKWSKPAYIEVFNKRYRVMKDKEPYSAADPKELLERPEIKFEVGKYYKTRSGAKLKLVAIFEPDSIGRCMAFLSEDKTLVLTNKNGDNSAGIYIISEWKEVVKRKTSYYAVLQPDGTSRMFSSKEDAEKALKNSPKGSRIESINLEWNGSK